MIARCGKYLCKPASDDKSDVVLFLKENIYDNSDDLKNISFSKLVKLVNYAKVIVCYCNDTIIGVAVYRRVDNYIDLLHMYVSNDFRKTRGSGLLNHYLINFLGNGCDVYLTSGDTSTFKKVIENLGVNRKYKINDRAREGLKKYMNGYISWSEF